MFVFFLEKFYLFLFYYSFLSQKLKIGITKELPFWEASLKNSNRFIKNGLKLAKQSNFEAKF